jgi:uncharacterized protein (TIGR03083 family)
MVDVLAGTDPTADVPSCPGWTLRDLIVHTGVVHRQKAETVRGGWVDESPPRPDEPDVDLESWFSNGVDDLLAVLSTADLSQPSWTWCNHDHTARWWVRRMAHETTIHASDAVLTAGGLPVLEPELAGDGVDEILIEMMTDGPSWGTIDTTDRIVELDILDDERGPWILRTAEFSGTSPTSGRTYQGLDTFVVVEDVAPQTTIRADASTLDLWLWGRGPIDPSAVAGDPDLADHVRRVAAESTG